MKWQMCLCCALPLALALLPETCWAGPAPTGTLTNVGFVLSNPAAGAHSNVTISYTTATILTAGDFFLYAFFPAGFTFTASGNSNAFCDANMTLTLNGTPTTIASLGATTCLTSPLLRIGTSVTIAAGTQISLTISSAIETNPSAAGLQTLIFLRTANGGGGAIDTPATLPSVNILASPPMVTGVSPASGSIRGGTLVTITGANFTGATAVHFGAVMAASFTVNSATSITATAPVLGALGVVNITVTTPGGTSATSAADHFAGTGGSAPAGVPDLSLPATGVLALLLAGLGGISLRRRMA